MIAIVTIDTTFLHAEVSAAEVTEIVPEVAETFEVSAFTKTEDEQGAGEQSTGSSDEGEHIEYTEEQLEKLQQRMKEHDIEWTDRNDKVSKASCGVTLLWWVIKSCGNNSMYDFMFCNNQLNTHRSKTTTT